MSPFDALFLAHLVGDFLFQTQWMAMNKAKNWLPLLVHSGIYTLFIALGAWLFFGGLSPVGLLLVFAAHVFLDRRVFVFWWSRTITKATGKESLWLNIVADQAFHLIVLALALKLTPGF